MKRYQYQPKCVDEIVVRQFTFEFPDDLDPNATDASTTC